MGNASSVIAALMTVGPSRMESGSSLMIVERPQDVSSPARRLVDQGWRRGEPRLDPGGAVCIAVGSAVWFTAFVLVPLGTILIVVGVVERTRAPRR